MKARKQSLRVIARRRGAAISGTRCVFLNMRRIVEALQADAARLTDGRPFLNCFAALV
jgi:hypothetical protein